MSMPMSIARGGDSMPSWDALFNAWVRHADPDVAGLAAQADACAAVIQGAPITPSDQRRLDRLNIIRAVR